MFTAIKYSMDRFTSKLPAAEVKRKRGKEIRMTVAEFTAFYPQFAGFTPAVVMETYIGQANGRFTSFSEADAEEARRLYTAHRLTLYARTALPDGAEATRARIAAAGQGGRRITGRRVGEVSVTYAAGASSSASASTGLADLPETDFGLQLLALTRLYARRGYLP